MEIKCEWFKDQFNVSLSSKEGAEPFMVVKGCRIVAGKDGDFISYPARKNEQTGKWWNHVWGSEKFNEAVLAKAKAAQPAAESKPARRANLDDMSDDIPFIFDHSVSDLMGLSKSILRARNGRKSSLIAANKTEF